MKVELIDTLKKLVDGNTVKIIVPFDKAFFLHVSPDPHISALQQRGLSVSYRKHHLAGDVMLSYFLPESLREGGRKLLVSMENKSRGSR
jgi:hypothetical protein